MNKHSLGRRHFLKTLTAIGTASLPVASVFGSRLVYAAGGAAKTAYDPAAKLEITVSEVEMRRNSAGRMLKARIYQPKGAGPFPSCSICTAAPGTRKTAPPRSRWTAPSRAAACSWLPLI